MGDGYGTPDNVLLGSKVSVVLVYYPSTFPGPDDKLLGDDSLPGTITPGDGKSFSGRRDPLPPVR